MNRYSYFLYTCFFLIPSSNENNLIYLRSSESGKHDKKKQISSGVLLKTKLETNNKALKQKHRSTLTWHTL